MPLCELRESHFLPGLFVFVAQVIGVLNMDFPKSVKPGIVVKPKEPASADKELTADGGQPAPKIEFPTPYSLKIVGDKDENFCRDMLDVVERFDSTLNRENISYQDSRNGRFRSLRVTITATSEDQLKAIFLALKETGRVHMVI